MSRRTTRIVLSIAAAAVLTLAAGFAIMRGSRPSRAVAPTVSSPVSTSPVTAGLTEAPSLLAPAVTPAVASASIPSQVAAGPTSVTPTARARASAPGEPGVASGMATASDCFYAPDNSSTPGQALTWTIAVPHGDSQQIDLSSEPTGPTGGHLASSPRLKAEEAGFTWRGLEVGHSYTWQVITSLGRASSKSPVQTFVVEPCSGGYTGP